MRCSDAEELMSLHPDVEAKLELTGTTVEHIKSCARCASRWESLRRVSDLFRSAPMVKPGDGFAVAVMQRIEGLEAARSKGRRAPVSTNAAGLIALGAVLAGNILSPAAAYAFAQAGHAGFTLDDLVRASWTLIPILRLYVDIGWDVAARSAALVEPSALLWAASISLMISALWMQVLKDHRGVEALN